jgi:hypothetical protein
MVRATILRRQVFFCLRFGFTHRQGHCRFAHSPEFLAPLGITQHLTPNRRNALAKVWERIRAFAEANGK